MTTNALSSDLETRLHDGSIRVSNMSTTGDWSRPFVIHPRIVKDWGPSQAKIARAKIARAMRAVKQVDGGFAVEATPEGTIRLEQSQGKDSGLSPKPKKPREFIL
jgi:hypothetical protein